MALAGAPARAGRGGAGGGRGVPPAATRHSIATLIAESKLAAVGVETPLAEGESDGRVDGAEGLAVKAAVPRSELPGLIPLLKTRGATDIVVSSLEQIVP